MAQIEIEGAEISESEALKLKALELIKKTYKLAGECKSVNNHESEIRLIDAAEGMREMLVELNMITEEESQQLNDEYWDNRAKIPQDFPDRF